MLKCEDIMAFVLMVITNQKFEASFRSDIQCQLQVYRYMDRITQCMELRFHSNVLEIMYT